jgi:uncharacterized protein YbjT (DUF2867 family)
MAPTILIVGATGNTGKSVVEHLPQLLAASKTLSTYRILALTRSKDSPASQQLAKIPKVEILEHNWVEITTAWLREHDVKRVFVASHNEPTQFAEESQFYSEALNASVEYVVRISTTAGNVHPGIKAYYPRSHWAIEQLLSQPEFKALQWTSLQSNVFFGFVIASAVQFVKRYRDTGKQTPISIMLDENTPVGVIEPYDVGGLAAHLLAEPDIAKYNQQKLVLNGPENITGRQIVELAEELAGVKAESVKFKDVEFVYQWADSLTTGSKNVIRSVVYAPEVYWEGRAKAATTSSEVLELVEVKGTLRAAFEGMLG